MLRHLDRLQTRILTRIHAMRPGSADGAAWPSSFGLLAALIAASYGLADATHLSGWVASFPAHELRGPLATAFAITGLVGAGDWRPRLVTALRALANLALAAAAGVVLADWFNASPAAAGPRLGQLSSLGMSLALLILAATLWPLRPSRRAELAAITAQLSLALLWAICAVALCSLLSARMLLDWLPLDAGMSWPTTLTLSLLAAAATMRTYQQPLVRAYFEAREDRQIFTSSLALLFGAIGLAAAVVGSLLTFTVVDSVKPMLMQGASGQALALDALIGRVEDAADRAATELAQSGLAAPGGALPPGWLRSLRQKLDPLGQVGIQVQMPGEPAVTEGSYHDEGQRPQLQVAGRQDLQLADIDGLVLHVERAPPRSAGIRLSIQVRPLRPAAQLPPLDLLGARAEVMLCADGGREGALCLSSARAGRVQMKLPARADGHLWPIQRAWRGQTGVMLLRDPSGAAAMVAHAPVGATGLGVVQKLAMAPLVARLTTGVPAVLLTLLGVAAVGASLLYRRAFPKLRMLRRAKAHLQATLTHLPRGVITLDAAGRVESSSAGAHRLFGLGAQQLEGQQIRDWISGTPAGTEWLLAPTTCEASLHTATHETIPVEVQTERFEFEGEPCAVLIIRDLRPELARRVELARWESIFIHAGWGVATSTEDGERLDLVNPAFARMHGYTVQELQQRPLLEVFAPRARAELPAQIARVHATGHHRFESWHQHRDGSVYPVLIDATLVRGADGRQFRVVNVQDISEQKRAQEAVQRSEALLQLVLRSLPVGVWIADREGRVLATNPAIARIWQGGFRLEDGRPVGFHARRLMSGQRVTDDDYPMLRAIRTGQATPGELIEIERPNGQRCVLMTAAVPLLGPDGEIQGAIAVNEDLTMVLRAEAAVIAARNLFEGLFEAAALGMAVCDAEGRFERTNRAFSELLGLGESSLLARTLTDLGEPEHADTDRATLARLRAGRQVKAEFERHWRRGDGSQIWVLVVISLVRLPDSEQAQFVVQALDVDASRRFRQALQASEARLLNAHRIAGLADWEWDAVRDVVTLSEQGLHVLGLPAGHPGLLEGKECLAHVHEDDRPAVRAALQAALHDGTPLAIDYRLRLDDGGERFIHQQGERAVGEPLRLVGVVQDITERKRVENELLQSRERLRALSANEENLIEQERRHIAREVHDELGQAMTALKMELSLLDRRLGAERALRDQVARMSAMVDGTLDVVRHVASNLRPSALDFGLVAAIEWLAEDFSLRWETPCEVHLDGHEMMLSETRATALFRIVQESLTNIARHARANHVEIHIASDGSTLRLTVRDDGRGFDPVQAQERGGRFGLLGMRERALKIGASLRLDSRPGKGTVVRVELPLKEAQEP